MSDSFKWAILTGEYPPQPGGVADYTAQVAAGLVRAGDDVTVLAPAAADCPPDGAAAAAAARGDVNVRRLAGHFGPRFLLALGRELRQLRPDRLLIQYVPHAFGYKALNLPFAAWVRRYASRRWPVWVLFHEVDFPFGWRPRDAVMATTHQLMARLVAKSAERVFVTIPQWGERIRRACRSAPLKVDWLPVGSNVATDAHPDAVRAVRDRLGAGPGRRLVGHFGTFNVLITPLLGPALDRLLREDEGVSILLIGRRANEYREGLASTSPQWAGRLVAVSGLGGDEVAAHLRACDLLVEPYPDGISTRRTTAMAALANGVPLVSNLGPLSEPFWNDLRCVSVAPAPDAESIAAAAERMLRMPPAEREAMGAAGRRLYVARFGIEQTICRLRKGVGLCGPVVDDVIPD